MKLHIHHKTTYLYDQPLQYALQQVRLTPKNRQGQQILEWQVDIDGGRIELEFDDHHNNHVLLASCEPGEEKLTFSAFGMVETTNTTGVIGSHGGYTPLWYFTRSTTLTKPGKMVRRLIGSLEKTKMDDLGKLHSLSSAIARKVSYQTGKTRTNTTAEEALSDGSGVCQDHAHVFLSAARLMGFPARYVSGFLMLNDTIEQEATHAWVEAYIDGLGWVGFDISNGISPDERYVPIATGLDYDEAAPISGIRFGSSTETMIVSLQVQQ